MKILSSIILLTLIFAGCDLFDSENNAASGTDDSIPPVDTVDSLGVNDSLGLQDTLTRDTAGSLPNDTLVVKDALGLPQDSSVISNDAAVTVVDSTSVPVESTTETIDSTVVKTTIDTIGHGSFCDSMAIEAENVIRPAIDYVKMCKPDTVSQSMADTLVLFYCDEMFNAIITGISFEKIYMSDKCYNNESAECVARKRLILDDVAYLKRECPVVQTQLDSIDSVLPIYKEVVEIDAESICDSIASDAEFYLEKMFQDYDDECLYVTPQCSIYMAPLTQYENEIKQACPSRSPSFKRFTSNDSTIIYLESEDGLYPEYCDADGDGVTTLEEKYTCQYDKNYFHECDYNLDDLLTPSERKSCVLLGQFGSCDTSGDGELDLLEKQRCDVIDSTTGCELMYYFNENYAACVYDTRPEVTKLRDSLSAECNTLLNVQLGSSTNATDMTSSIWEYNEKCLMDELKYTMPVFDNECQSNYTAMYESEYIYLSNKCTWGDERNICNVELDIRINLSEDLKNNGCIQQARVSAPHWSYPLIYF
ncbi:MAG: hypothetical protein OCD01_18775 [Fibrobacterales bacterium]